MYCLKAQSAKNRSNLARFTTKNLLLPLLLPRIAVEIVHVKTLITVCLFRLSSPPKKKTTTSSPTSTPRGLEDVSSYPRLFAELLGQGWTAEELEQLAGRNLLRVLGAVEKVRENQRLSGVRPYEDIPPAIRPEEHANCTTNS